MAKYIKLIDRDNAGIEREVLYPWPYSEAAWTTLVSTPSEAGFEVNTTGDSPAIVANSETAAAISGTATGAFTPGVRALAEGSGNGIEAQSDAGYSIWAQHGSSGNNLPVVVSQQRGAATGNLFEGQNNGGSTVFAVTATGGIFATLPTADPAVAGQLWSDSGVVKVSAG